MPRTADADLAGAQVDVRPLEAARFAAAQPEGHRADCDRLALVSPQRAEVGTDLARLHRAWAVRRLARQLYAGGGGVVHPHTEPAYGPADNLPQGLVRLFGGPRQLKRINPALYALGRYRLEFQLAPAR